MGSTEKLMSHSVTIDTNQRIEINSVEEMDKKRHIHNEIEKKRRNKFNDCFVRLSEVVPIFANRKIKPTKALVVSKATEYIQELCFENTRINGTQKENEILSNELEAIRHKLVVLEKENLRLKALIRKYDISIND